MRLILIGFGRVGRDLAQIIADRYRPQFKVVAIVTGRHGSLVDPAGIDLQAVLRGGLGGPQAGAPSALEVITSTEADAVVELSTLNVYSGRPAIDHVEAALKTGKHVVTANKGPIAWDYERLAALARQAGRRLLFESTVMDGTPVFNVARYGLRGCHVTGFSGILNSTTNYILARMEEGASNAEAVAEAQRQGFAEADPTLDVEGWDAAAKVAALANVLMGAGITPLMVERQGITGVTAADLAAARAEGETIKLVCEAYPAGHGEAGTAGGGQAGTAGSAEAGTAGGPAPRPIARVAPRRVPLSSDFGRIPGTTSILTLRTDMMGDITIVEHEPALMQTAYGVLNDLLEIIGEEGPQWPKTKP